MGLAMVKHLIGCDYPVTVTDISPDAITAAEALGASAGYDGPEATSHASGR